MFFTAIHQMMTENVDLTIVIRKANGQLTVATLPKSNGLKDEAQNHIVPLTVTGTPQELDAGFLQTVTRPIQKAGGLIANMAQFEAQADKAAANSKAAREAKSKESKEEREKREKYEKLMKKAEEMTTAKNYREALNLLGQAKSHANEAQLKGIEEKIQAATECGAIPVIIGRPVQEKGISVKECKRMLPEKFGFQPTPHVVLLGIGMGSKETLTLQGNEAVEQADLIIGARRMADAVALPGQDVFYEYRSAEIAEYIKKHPEYEKVVIALSGDVGFYSGAKGLLKALDGNAEIICGISSVVYFMSKIGLSWDDAKIVSAHGRGCNLISYIRNEKKVFAILGTSDGVAILAKKLVEYGMGNVLLYVGENLSYDNEKIFVKKADELTEYTGDPLSVICAVNETGERRLETHGIRDEEFIRGKAPMTKEEVRTVSLFKLRLTEDSICYDVGAGTGSLSIEMALRAHQGKVWAIEKKEDAVELIRQNKVKFAADNLEIIEGLAPEALTDLPAPTHAFIGGSSGNLKEIVRLLIEKNPQIRIVINCITLETVSEALETAKEFGFEENEIVQLSAARSKAIGRYHMMMGENPIYIITLQNPQK